MHNYLKINHNRKNNKTVPAIFSTQIRPTEITHTQRIYNNNSIIYSNGMVLGKLLFGSQNGASHRKLCHVIKHLAYCVGSTFFFLFLNFKAIFTGEISFILSALLFFCIFFSLSLSALSSSSSFA